MEYRFCPICRSPLTSQSQSNGKQNYLACSACDFIHYKNPKPCAVAVIVRAGKILLIRRANNPYKNYWDFPGGFIECDEHPKGGLKREIAEELKIRVKIIRFLGIYTDSYGPAGDATVNIYYLCKKLRGEIMPQDEIAKARWFDIDKTPRKIAFNTNAVIEDLKKRGLSFA